MRHAYVYYRVAPDQAEPATAGIDALLAAMAPHCVAAPRRLLRCDDPHTWMEVYEGIADWPAFEAALQARLDALHIPELLDGPRHLECFTAPAATA
ncbi:MAG: DUF4936 family protein [Gammaproteobacteria bacterium]